MGIALKFESSNTKEILVYSPCYGDSSKKPRLKGFLHKYSPCYGDSSVANKMGKDLPLNIPLVMGIALMNLIPRT